MTRLNITIACLAVIAALICSAYGGPPVRPKTKDSPVKARGTGTPPTTPSAKDEETYVLDKIFNDKKGALGLTREGVAELYSSEEPDTDLAFPDTLAKSGTKTCPQLAGIPDGYYYEKLLGFWYDNRMNWNDARAYCRALQVQPAPGHYWDLPIMLSETDRSCINYVRRSGCRVFRHAPLGLQAPKTQVTPFTDDWTWINGVPLTTPAVTYPDPVATTWPGSFWFSGWWLPIPFSSPQPNGGGIGEEGNCGGTFYLNGEWFDVPCDTADNDRFTCVICQQYPSDIPDEIPLE